VTIGMFKNNQEKAKKMNEFLLLEINETLRFVIFLIDQGIVKDIKEAANSEIHEGGVIEGFLSNRTTNFGRYFTVTVNSKVYPIFVKDVVREIKGIPTSIIEYYLLNQEKYSNE
jgi:hypothetical protein